MTNRRPGRWRTIVVLAALALSTLAAVGAANAETMARGISWAQGTSWAQGISWAAADQAPLTAVSVTARGISWA